MCMEGALDAIASTNSALTVISILTVPYGNEGKILAEQIIPDMLIAL